ncbi:MAG: hypothetical protein ABJN42_03650, partial [Roseibium sp.]|uniref:hypothetical protein n=1 Tax=Roseibium sp. TaxID=1936156 RepID=UPI00329A6C01
TMIEQRDPSWRDFVPAKLWDYYEWEYPPHLRAAVITDGALPDPEAYPVGTKLIRKESEGVLVLRDDGKWRARTAAENNKSMGD